MRPAATLITALSLVFGVPAVAQSLDDLDIQIHGYATQGFLYSTKNNLFTATTSDGSPAWTEVVVNISAQPMPKLSIGFQGRYFVLGQFGNTITVDWAAGDYRQNDYLGVRFGKVKTPIGLFNEIQDIDPSYMWSLLPQGVYPISSRNSQLAHFGGVVYGAARLGKKLGKLEYRGWVGERVVPGTDGFFVTARELGVNLPNGMSVSTYGANLRWKTPLPGLMAGASVNVQNTAYATALIQNGALAGTQGLGGYHEPSYFALYDRKKITLAAEYTRVPLWISTSFPAAYSIPTFYQRNDLRTWYAMASYKVNGKLTAGGYVSQFFDHEAALGPGRYSKDRTISARYDFNQFLYAKAEQHFISGTAQDYDLDLNPNLQPTTRLTILKLGVSF